MSAPGAVVFAYHNVGEHAACACSAAHGIDVRLVVTHADDPAETLWFERVSDVAGDLAVFRADMSCRSLPRRSATRRWRSMAGQ